jgi:hypothetical protein
VPLLNEKLKKFLVYWFDLVTRTIIKNIEYQGNVYIMLEDIDLIIDKETEKINRAEFWIPE